MHRGFENSVHHIEGLSSVRERHAGKKASDEISLAEFVGLCSAACNRPVVASLAIPGIVRLSGSMDELKGLEDILRVAKNAEAKRILLPFRAIRG